MTLFGKSAIRLEVMAADFLPHEDQLFLIVADAECNLHVLQFDPERTQKPCSSSVAPSLTFIVSQIQSHCQACVSYIIPYSILACILRH